jgi:hypothetical protein
MITWETGGAGEGITCETGEVRTWGTGGGVGATATEGEGSCSEGRPIDLGLPMRDAQLPVISHLRIMHTLLICIAQ